MVFGNGVKNIQAAAYNGAHTVVVSELFFLLCNENLNSFLTRVRKLYKGGKYSREETI